MAHVSLCEMITRLPKNCAAPSISLTYFAGFPSTVTQARPGIPSLMVDKWLESAECRLFSRILETLVSSVCISATRSTNSCVDDPGFLALVVMTRNFL